MNVAGYRRVSTQEQASHGVSLAIQRNKIEQYCKLHDLTLVAMESDEGVSAKSLKRPGLQLALDHLREGRADGLVVAKLEAVRPGVPAELARLAETARAQMSQGLAREVLTSASTSVVAELRDAKKLKTNPDLARTAIGLEPLSKPKTEKDQ